MIGLQSKCVWCSQREPGVGNMKKESLVKRVDELRRKYDLSQLNGAIWGKYYRRASARNEYCVD
jgi:hypothetical protein